MLNVPKDSSTLTQIDISVPIDLDFAMQFYDNNTESYLNMLEKLEMYMITPILLNDFAQAFESSSHEHMYTTAVHLKEQCIKLGASHLYYYCKQIEQFYKKDDFQTVLRLYPNLVESTIETKLYAKKILKKYKRSVEICKKTAKNEHSVLFKLR